MSRPALLIRTLFCGLLFTPMAAGTVAVANVPARRQSNAKRRTNGRAGSIEDAEEKTRAVRRAALCPGEGGC